MPRGHKIENRTFRKYYKHDDVVILDALDHLKSFGYVNKKILPDLVTSIFIVANTACEAIAWRKEYVRLKKHMESEKQYIRKLKECKKP